MKHWPSWTSWIATGSSMFRLMERFCLTQRILLPSTVGIWSVRALEDRKYPLPVSIFDVLDVNVLVALIRSLLHWVSERYVSLFKLWTVYSWLTFQFSTVPGPDLKCMAASWMSLMGVLFTHGLTNNVIMFLTFFLRETEGTLRSDNGNTSKNTTEKLNSGPNSNYFSSKLSSLLKIGKWSWRPHPSSDRRNKIYRLAVHLLKINK